VIVATRPITRLQFTESGDAPTIGWSTAGRIGFWTILPAVERHAVTLNEEAAAVGFLADGSAYLVSRGGALGILSCDDDDDAVHGWRIAAAPIVSAQVSGDRNGVVGLADGTVVLIHDDRTSEPLRLVADRHAEVAVAMDVEGRALACAAASVFELVPPTPKRSASARLLRTMRGAEGWDVLAFDGQRVVLRTTRDELALIDVRGATTDAIRLAPMDATDSEGFQAAAVSADGAAVAATCGSYLHLWRRTGHGKFSALAITPLIGGVCLDFSADSTYLSVGTEAGSVITFLA
jgi:hypothetical protein